MFIAALILATALQAKPPLTFEVASVKATDPAQHGTGSVRHLPGGQTYVADGATVRMMIRTVYQTTDSQIQGGPAWINTERFDVRAKAEKPSSADNLRQMFQTLLADRFSLKFHREMRTVPAYALTVDRPGKLKVSDGTEPSDVPIQRMGFGKSKGTRVSILSLLVAFRTGRHFDSRDRQNRPRQVL